MPDWVRRSLAAKLLAGQLLVIAAGAGTLLAVALVLGPDVFHSHVRDALGYVPADVARHLDRAFQQATLVALVVGIAAAVVTALAVSVLVSRRVVRPIHALAGAAGTVAAGAYTARVPPLGDDELGVLADAFNEMAASLATTEQRRRELLSDVAHELRTPLATIGAYVEGIADGVVAPGPQAWQALQAETRRLTRLVDDLQTVSRAEERQLDLAVAPTPADAVVGDAVTAATPAFEAKGVALAAHVDPHLPALAVDRDRTGEVLANLLANALRHTPAGGRVEVSARRDGAAVELRVADTGDGIAPEHLERIFERFYRVDAGRSRASGGSGIGLAIARAIVEAHGGSIHAESAGAGQGATFVVRLPAAD